MIVALIGSSAWPLRGQDGFRFRSGVDLINVTATVTDASGHVVSGLTQDDFVIYDDDRPVDVTLFNAERVPVSIGIVLDTSGSMQGDKIANAVGAIERFLDRLLVRDDEAFLYGFSSEVELLQEWTSDRRALGAALRRVRATGGTAMYDAVAEAVPVAGTGQNRKKAILLISDGNDTNSRLGVRDVRQVVRESEVLVYGIGIDGQGEPTLRQRQPRFPPAPMPFPFPGRGRMPIPTPSPPWNSSPRGGSADDRLNVAALREITDDSGGRTEIVRNARDLDPAASSIATELSQQYYLGYHGTGLRDGRWHTIRVEMRNPSHRARARRGYLATS